MTKEDFIEDNTSVLIIKDGILQLNKNYDKERNYYAKIWEEKQFTEQLLKEEDYCYGNSKKESL